MAESTQGQTPYFYMLIMLFTGACNTLLMKFLVMQVASPAAGAAGKPFDYPFFQTMLMMLGELMCLGAYFHSVAPNNKTENSNFPMWIMALPVTCDWTATTLVNAAYVILPASTIQMCRGCIVIFTCLFSVVFLGRRQQTFHYVGVALVALGITIVSLQALFEPSGPGPMNPRAPWIGIGLVLAAQLFQATMLVVEEKFLGKYNVPPLQMVGLEGLFGSILGVFILFSLQQIGMESSTEALYMMQSSKAVQFGCIASMFSIAFFNWSGVTVTMQASAVARSTIDVSRTALIWAVELFMLWNTFSWLQLVGFVVLIAGTLIYNELVVIPCLQPHESARSILEDKDCHA
jgi:drug/metabolite transporter (DMT)-like permease